MDEPHHELALMQRRSRPMTRFRKLTLAAFLAITAMTGVAATFTAPAHADEPGCHRHCW
jgi:hypothetical protein